ncbi:general stress protein [Actinomyces sp. MRS3W]|uniref:general stress protein n=1 Tax=Actinomyces sp. MRS3W TaxID=2800796 RepID=UPI0028FD4AC6|nr:general stress protein [Actinomyces sp. MRS3W]MDU0347691.1 general stress protein [Actinomyces sp. MRS3W]
MSTSQFSTQTPPLAAPRGGLIPRGDEVASFSTYAEAQHAVDSLSDSGFPVQYLAIIGTDLRQVEHITGRMSWGRAVANGAGSGLWIGIFFAAMMLLLGPSTGTGTMMIAAVLMGLIWGIVFQVAAYAVTRGKRDFTSVSQVVASRYSVIASQLAAEAARALADIPGNLTRGGEAARRAEERRAARQQARGGAPSAFGSGADEQPRFGVRLPEGVDVSTYSQQPAEPAAAPESGDAQVSARSETPTAPDTTPDAGPHAEAQTGGQVSGQDVSDDDPYLRRPDDTSHA